MKNSEIPDELADLRAQLEALRQAREADAASPQPETVDAVETEIPAAEAPAAETDELLGSELSGQFQELMEQIDQELKESNPTTLLAVFALGILVGRLLPR